MKTDQAFDDSQDWLQLAGDHQHAFWQTLGQWQSSAPLFNIETPEAILRYKEDPIEHHTLQLKDVIQENALKFDIPAALLHYHQKAARQGADPQFLGALVIQAIAYGIAFTLQSEQQHQHYCTQYHKNAQRLLTILKAQENNTQDTSQIDYTNLLAQQKALDDWHQTYQKTMLSSIKSMLTLQEQLFHHLHRMREQQQAMQCVVQSWVDQWVDSGAMTQLLASMPHVSPLVTNWLETHGSSLLSERITHLILQSNQENAIHNAPKIVFAAFEKVLNESHFMTQESLEHYFEAKLDAAILDPTSLNYHDRSESFSSEDGHAIREHRDLIHEHRQEAQISLEQTRMYQNVSGPRMEECEDYLDSLNQSGDDDDIASSFHP